MKKICSVILCFLLVWTMALQVHAVSSVPESVISATESVVRVVVEYLDGYTTGSGFVIKSDNEETLIVTNHHVVEGKPYSISIWLGKGESVSASVMFFSSQNDLCVLKLAYPVSLKALTFSINGAKQGEAVFAVGYPGAADFLSDTEAHSGVEATITDGIVSAIRMATVTEYGTPIQILQINAAINSGNSGGPLFNANGEVVGINTYGINESQGIFGAIDIRELTEFLISNSIAIMSPETSTSWAIVVVIGFAFCVGVAGLFILKRKRISSSSKAEKAVSLREYMNEYTNGLGENEAVALLLPIALKIRDLHNNGETHLQISPDAIFIGEKGSFLAETTGAESDRYSSGYAAPEIYRGIISGNLADIYSFCAVLSFVATGKQPQNSLLRNENEDSYDGVANDTQFCAVVNKGMALAPSMRFSTMQDIIIMLSPYNIKAFDGLVCAEKSSLSLKTRKKSRRISVKVVSGIVVSIVVIALLATYIGCYLGARGNAQNGQFELASKLLIAKSITNLHDPQLVAYIEAGLMLDCRRYEEASGVFKKIHGYLDADEMAMEADYRYALQCADANEFDKAAAMLSILSKAGFKDAEKKMVEVSYRKGVYLLFEKADYYEADLIFSQLAEMQYEGAEEMRKETQYRWAWKFIDDKKYVAAYKKLDAIRGYSDVNETISSLTEMMYLEGQKLYYEESFHDAEKIFKCIIKYRDSKKYVALINARNSVEQLSNPEEIVRSLRNIFDFEDAAELLVSNTSVACHFLLGTWRTDNGGYYFTMEEGEDGFICLSNLPHYGGSFVIIGGISSVTNKTYANKEEYAFYLLTPNSMMIYCFKNGQTYVLRR